MSAVAQIIQAIAALISLPAFWVLFVLAFLYSIFMAYVDALDAPVENDTKAYKHWFKFANRLCFRLKRAAIAFHVEDEDKADAAGAGK